MAAHLEGKGVVTQDAGGLAQKGGATWSHVQIANRPEAIFTTKVDTAQADLVIACDSIVGAMKYTLTVMQQGRSFVALNTHGTPTAAFVKNPDWQFPGAHCEAAVRASVGDDHLGAFDAEQVAVQMLGDSLYTNPLMLGYAWQQGRIPLVARGADARHRAQRRAGRQQQGGLRMGPPLRPRPGCRAGALCRAAGDPDRAQAGRWTSRWRGAWPSSPTTRTRPTRRATGPSSNRCARPRAPLGVRARLGEAVARYLFKLMAYKDEYEVARLHTDPAFAQQIAAMFEGEVPSVHHLAPPLLAKTDDKGELSSRSTAPGCTAR
jgi:indolepyruvate ferredoxin oxidoreductase